MRSPPRPIVSPGHRFTVDDLTLIAVRDVGDDTNSGCKFCAIRASEYPCNVAPICTITIQNPDGLIFVQEQDYIIRRMKGRV